MEPRWECTARGRSARLSWISSAHVREINSFVGVGKTIKLPLKPDAISHLSRADIARIQIEGMSAMLAEIEPRNRFYQNKFAEAGLDSPIEIKGLDELRKLPFTTKDELIADQEIHPPYGSFLTYPIESYIRMHQTSGTKGRPLRWVDTRDSWDWIMHLWEVIYFAAGIKPTDRFFFPFSFGPFLGFWAGFDAAVRLGHLTIPGGGMTTRARLQCILDHEINVVGCTPTYAMHLAEVAEREGIALQGSKVHTIIVAGEPGGNIPEVKRRIESAWGVRCLDHSGMTEIGSLGFEFRENPGSLYLIETECIAEIIDPATGDPAPEGEKGELVLTNLGRWGSPLIRYRTGDIVQAETQPCPLGTSLIRLKGGILGRGDDMVLIRGNNVYPAALESIIRRFPEVAEYRADISSRQGLAVLSLTIECVGDLQSNGSRLSEAIAIAVKDALNFRPEVAAVEPGTLPRFELKASRFIIHPSYGKESL